MILWYILRISVYNFLSFFCHSKPLLPTECSWNNILFELIRFVVPFQCHLCSDALWTLQTQHVQNECVLVKYFFMSWNGMFIMSPSWPSQKSGHYHCLTPVSFTLTASHHHVLSLKRHNHFWKVSILLHN